MIRPADIAHGILPWLGIVATLQVPITQWLVSAGVPLRVADVALGGVGLVVTAWSKHIDSASYTAIQTKRGPAPPSG